MFEIKEGRILIGGASVKLPEGMFLCNTTLMNGIVFSDNTGSYKIDLREISQCLNLNEILVKDMENEKCCIISGVNELTLNGLKGYYCIYKYCECERYEAILRDDSAASNSCLLILISAKKKASIECVMNKNEIKKFFCDLHVK